MRFLTLLLALSFGACNDNPSFKENANPETNGSLAAGDASRNNGDTIVSGDATASKPSSAPTVVSSPSPIPDASPSASQASASASPTPKPAATDVSINNPQHVLVSVSVSSSSAVPICKIGQKFYAEAHYSDGLLQDVSAQATWTLADPSIATYDAANGLTPKNVGTTQLQASFGGMTGSTSLSVVIPDTSSVAKSIDTVSLVYACKATDNLVGIVTATHRLNNLHYGEAVTGAEWKIHSVDFPSIVASVASAPVLTNSDLCLYSQNIASQMRYKYALYPTLYTDQEYHAYTKDSISGTTYDFKQERYLTVTPDNDNSQPTAANTYSGLQGSALPMPSQVCTP